MRANRLTETGPVRLLIAAVVVVGMLGLGPTHGARAASKDLGCPSYTGLVNAINAAASGDVLKLACSTPTTIALSGTITIRKNLILDASGSPAPITLDGGGTVRLITVQTDAAFGLNSLTLYRGGGSAFGGAIYNSGTLTVAASTLSSNSATDGGAIYSTGTVAISNSTFTGNSGGSSSGAVHAVALGSGALTITNSTFSGNASGSSSGAVQSGVSAPATVGASIFANNSGGNCRFPFQLKDNGYNLTDSGGNCGLTGSTDLVNTDPLLSALANNGGPTQTMALSYSSPAIGRVPRPLCPATDQRGAPRAAGPKTGCDIGAYETPPILSFNAVQQCKDHNLWPTTSPPPLPASSLASATVSAHQIVAGWVFLDGSTPVEGATVRLVTPSGRSLSAGSDTTNADGVFLLSAGRLPSSFRVVASAGTVEGQRFTGTLTTRVAGYRHLAPLYVDPATTLVDHYITSHRGATIGRATGRVKHLLGVPGWASLGSDLEISDRYFNGDAFLLQAAHQGGVNRLTSKLAVAAGRGQRHTFHATGRFRPKFVYAGLNFMLEKVAGGAGSYAGGKALSWVLSQFGVKSDSAQVMDQLNAIQSQLADVRRDTQDIKRDVAQINKKINENLLATILQNIKIRPADIDDAEAGIKLVADSATKPAASRETLACGVLYYYIKPVATSNFERVVYQAYTSPTLGVPSLMQAYIDVVRSGGRWFTDQSSQDVRHSVGYWQTYQALSAQVRMEWEHANGCPGGTGCTDVTELVPTVTSYADAEERRLPKMLPRYTFLDSRTGMMWAPNAYVRPDFDRVTITKGGTQKTYTWWGGDALYAADAVDNVNFVNATNAEPAGSPSHRDLFGGFSDWKIANLEDIKTMGSDWTGQQTPFGQLLRTPLPLGPGIARAGGSLILTTEGNNWRFIDLNLPPFKVYALPTDQYAGMYFFVRPEPNAAQYLTPNAGGLQSQPGPGQPGPDVAALPDVTSESWGGSSARFDVFFDSADPGDGRVLFGAGPDCTGLIETATIDDGAGTTSHLVHVTGDDLNGMSGALLPGVTYSFEVQTVTENGVETDDNSGQCYSVTIPPS